MQMTLTESTIATLTGQPLVEAWYRLRGDYLTANSIKRLHAAIFDYLCKHVGKPDAVAFQHDDDNAGLLETWDRRAGKSWQAALEDHVAAYRFVPPMPSVEECLAMFDEDGPLTYREYFLSTAGQSGAVVTRRFFCTVADAYEATRVQSVVTACLRAACVVLLRSRREELP